MTIFHAYHGSFMLSLTIMNDLLLWWLPITQYTFIKILSTLLLLYSMKFYYYNDNNNITLRYLGGWRTIIISTNWLAIARLVYILFYFSTHWRTHTLTVAYHRRHILSRVPPLRRSFDYVWRLAAKRLSNLLSTTFETNG